MTAIGGVGVEPTTLGLKGPCSTTELPAQLDHQAVNLAGKLHALNALHDRSVLSVPRHLLGEAERRVGVHDPAGAGQRSELHDGRCLTAGLNGSAVAELRCGLQD